MPFVYMQALKAPLKVASKTAVEPRQQPQSQLLNNPEYRLLPDQFLDVKKLAIHLPYSHALVLEEL